LNILHQLYQKNRFLWERKG